jgi:hypothetical protein
MNLHHYYLKGQSLNVNLNLSLVSVEQYLSAQVVLLFVAALG